MARIVGAARFPDGNVVLSARDQAVTAQELPPALPHRVERPAIAPAQVVAALVEAPVLEVDEVDGPEAPPQEGGVVVEDLGLRVVGERGLLAGAPGSVAELLPQRAA